MGLFSLFDDLERGLDAFEGVVNRAADAVERGADSVERGAETAERRINAAADAVDRGSQKAEDYAKRTVDTSQNLVNGQSPDNDAASADGTATDDDSTVEG